MPQLSPKVRNGLYIALVLLNTVLAVLSGENAMPAAYAHYVALASLVVAALMKQFGAPELPPAQHTEPVPVAPPPGVN